jgi:hypothetical protein
MCLRMHGLPNKLLAMETNTKAQRNAQAQARFKVRLAERMARLEQILAELPEVVAAAVVERQRQQQEQRRR